MKIVSLSTLAGASLMLVVGGACAEQYLPEIASKAPYKKAYAEMLSHPTWVSKAQGTASPVEKVSAEGKSFTVGHMCKPHDCADNQLIVVFNADGTKSWGLLATRPADGEAFSKQLLGNPDSVVQGLLNKSFSDNNPED
ncbi:Ivy family c-type lysozyme inhibitor [Pseudomonas haemolytica]|uniref:Lysozyme inhibitor n=1 Tax=Pseudomonas haemolytica TaxID=2600065 RepID=A0A5P1D8H3_9PSED|nr:Ivy family c-type lysozyme inhibitor [Pseudomonas haemolytica]MBJ2244831.1 lysozyme inhibitor [Pseudomonas haemolytica]MBJ2275319.1 lysozyme inhibitor [Pseudomonas haemolytica]MBK3446504.1 lysozyme inhibitor [Pseudomonas haemolytica]MBK3458000.1 lysozyme inhibitor [Pseudomonas haemolytica]MRJ36636.1 lysozyme inhibitor [Pseudomonas haemolytica]